MPSWGWSAITIYQHTSFTANSSTLLFFLLMNKILKCGVCFQKRGMKNYCVDTWLVSLPPTLALSDNTPGCPSPFEMLMAFLNVLLQNSPPPPSFLHPLHKFSLPAALSVCSLSSWLSTSFSASSCLFFGSLETAVCYNICLSVFFFYPKITYWCISTQLLQLNGNTINTMSFFYLTI